MLDANQFGRFRDRGHPLIEKERRRVFVSQDPHEQDIKVGELPAIPRRSQSDRRKAEKRGNQKRREFPAVSFQDQDDSQRCNSDEDKENVRIARESQDDRADQESCGGDGAPVAPPRSG